MNMEKLRVRDVGQTPERIWLSPPFVCTKRYPRDSAGAE